MEDLQKCPCPYATAFIATLNCGLWLGDAICNTLFLNDETMEQYEKMKCLREFEILLKDVSQDIGKAYLDDMSVDNAKDYLSSVDALFATAYLSGRFAQEYADILYGDTIVATAWGKQESAVEFTNSLNARIDNFEQYEY